MPAHLVVCGEPPPGSGGEFEDECVRALVAGLSEHYTIVRSVSISRGGGAFAEYDIIVVGPSSWEILEVKCITPFAEVYEDHIASSGGFVAERVFSRLDMKAKILSGRRLSPPFSVSNRQSWITTAVVLPDTATITVHEKREESRSVVRSLRDTISHFREKAGAPSASDRTAMITARASWESYASRSAPSSQRTNRYLGRYLIRRRFDSPAGTYQAIDEPPCCQDVHLREFPLDATLSRRDLEAYVDDVAREMRTLRRIRHPYVSCVIGHFATGCSFVQVSDWFDGRPLEESWESLLDSSISQRIGICFRLASALAHCHDKGVFHRNISARNVLLSPDGEDLRLTGFELARDLDMSSSLSAARLGTREPRLIPPEELARDAEENARLGDVFQLGVLFYRIMENGAWPFEDPVAFTSSAEPMRPMSSWSSQGGDPRAHTLVSQMLALSPAARPDPLQRVEALLRAIAGS